MIDLRLQIVGVLVAKPLGHYRADHAAGSAG